MQNYTVTLPTAEESFSSWCHRLKPRTAAQWKIIEDVLILKRMISTELQSRDPDFELLPMFEARIKAAFGLRSIAFFDRFRAECHWLIPHVVADRKLTQ
ncbi:hypothetical protein [Pseudomonas amygdali]